MKKDFKALIWFGIVVVIVYGVYQIPIFNNIFYQLRGDNIDLILTSIAEIENHDLNEQTLEEDKQIPEVETAYNIDNTIDIEDIEQNKKLTIPLNILIVGDSLIITECGQELERRLTEYEGIIVKREGKYSTGLNRIDYFDWYKRTNQLVNDFFPDVIIVFFGANDGQKIKDENGRTYRLYSDKWEEVYSKRVHDFMQLTSTNAKKVYWIGHPIAANKDFTRKFALMNSIYEKQAEEFENVTFINSWDRFAINGKYAPFVENNQGVKVKVKYSDGVHLTSNGARIMADLVFEYLEEDIDFGI